MDDFTSPTNISWLGDVGRVEYGGGDKGMIAMFYNRPMHNPVKSQEHGRPVYEDKVYVRIHPPGERLNIVDREASQSDKRRFPNQYRHFQENTEQHPEGTPIDLLYPESPAIAAMLRANGVSTIELCAELSAQAIDTIGMGCQQYVNAAAKYLEASNKGVKVTQMRHELEVRDREIKVLKQMVEEMKGTISSMKQNNVGGVPDLAALQALIAASMQRPVHMPQAGFDAQSALINANSPTAQVEQAQPKRRARPRVTG